MKARHSGTVNSIIMTKETVQVPLAVNPRKNSNKVVKSLEVENIIPTLMMTTAM